MTLNTKSEGQLTFHPDRRGATRPEVPVRRHYERLHGPCVALVRGVDASGEEFTESTVLNDVSAGGLCVKLHRDVPLGTRLFVVFAFSTIALQSIAAPTVAARGEVRRVERADSEVDDADHARGVAIQFRHYRFL